MLGHLTSVRERIRESNENYHKAGDYPHWSYAESNVCNGSGRRVLLCEAIVSASGTSALSVIITHSAV